jgi:predicted enzyme related to lactoylglutathione lyase
MAVASPSLARAERFPAINTPAGSEHIPGKLIWADLFTTDPDGASKFYCDLLGWTAAPLEQKGRSYTVFSNQGRPVAGLAPRSVQGGSHPSRWIGYLAVADIDATLVTAAKDGATVRAPSHGFPDRGHQAIVSDKESVPIGLLQSSSGDPADGEPRPGDWNWFELYVKSPADEAAFYKDVFGIVSEPDTKTDRKGDFIISSGGQARGGVAPIPGEADAKPSWLGVIRVADLDATLAKVPGLGGQVLVAPHAVEYGSRFAIILDSTGGTVGLVQYAENENPANTP